MFKGFIKLLIIGLFGLFPLGAAGQGRINYDRQTIEAIGTAYVSQVAIERASSEYMEKILDHYTGSELATAGIFASKWLDRRAMTDVGLFGNSNENHYYKHIIHLVKDCIAPKLLTVAGLMIKNPERALYWGPYLLKTTEQVKQLCMTFEVVVTNGRLTFEDLAAQGCFLVLNDDIKAVFDLARLGSVDWESLWTKLTEFGQGLTKDDLIEDFNRLLKGGEAVASAGGAVLSDAWQNGSRITDVFKMKPKELLDLYDQFEDMYDDFSDVANIKSLVMEKIISTDSTGVARLFTTDGYNISSYVTDYLNELEGRYYTQKWYIYAEGQGSKVECDYNPPMDNESVAYGSEWYRIKTGNSNYSPTAAEQNAALANSESYAGWSRDWVSSLNSDPMNQVKYSFSSFPHYSKLVDNKGNTTAWALAYSIKVTRAWYVSQNVYEETFDSQYQDEDAMTARMNALCEDYYNSDHNIDDGGAPLLSYRVGKGSKNYYQMADASRMKGCAAATFLMSCDESAGLGEGTFSWKENSSHDHDVNDYSKELAMASAVSDYPSCEVLDGYIDDYTLMLEDLRAQLDSVKAEQLIFNSTVLEAKRKNLEMRIDTTSVSLGKMQYERQEFYNDLGDELDGACRIPTAMKDMENAYGITWTDEGHWEGFSYIRHGRLPEMESVLKFQADLSRTRKESHFLGVRIHRAILSVHWTLGADYTSSTVLDVMELDGSLSDDEKAAQVNDRRAELTNDHPGCKIDVEYAYSNPNDSVDDQDALHLLWVSDRLAIARDVDHRLMKIYSELILIEKFLRQKQSLKDFFERVTGLSGPSKVRRFKLGNKAFKRWFYAARRANANATVEDLLLYLEDDDDDDVTAEPEGQPEGEPSGQSPGESSGQQTGQHQHPIINETPVLNPFAEETGR